MLLYVIICDIINLVLGDPKISFIVKIEAQVISNTLEGKIRENVPRLHKVPDLTVQTSAVSVFNQVLLLWPL